MPHSAFDTLPIIDLSLAENPSTKAICLEELRHALFNIGFMYIKNTGIPQNVVDDLKKEIPKLFDLPITEKQKLAMVNAPFFTGYTALGNEITAKAQDAREQFDFAHEHEFDWIEGDASWKKMRGPNQWPPATLLPNFRQILETYMNHITSLSRRFLHLVSEALFLPPTTFDPHSDPLSDDYSRLKIVKYPPVHGYSQGCGPHKDSIAIFTFLQADNEPGLQVLNSAGEWIDALPIEGTFVVNIAAGFEAITGGLCPATTHRVLTAVTRERYSVPFFMGMRFSTTLADLQRNVPDVVQRITGNRKMRKDDVVSSEFLDPRYDCLGEAHLRNRIISHPDVGKRWYPELYSKYTSN